VGVGAVKATERRRLVDRSRDVPERRADHRVLDDRGSVGPDAVADLRDSERLIVVLDRPAPGRLLDELDQPELGERADVIAHGSQRRPQFVGQLARTGPALLEDPEQLRAKRVREGAHEVHVAEVGDSLLAHP
jgi:hypothetical protein